MRGKQQTLCAIVLILLGALPGVVTPVSAVQISDLVWQNRPLLLFAQTLDDSRLQQTKHNLQQRRCELKDREMVIGIIVEQGHSILADQPITPMQAASLRTRFAIEHDRFAVILIGKDGGEKYRLYDIPELDEIFALIDGMPMRQEEMIQMPVDCGSANNENSS